MSGRVIELFPRADATPAPRQEESGHFDFAVAAVLLTVTLTGTVMFVGLVEITTWIIGKVF